MTEPYLAAAQFGLAVQAMSYMYVEFRKVDLSAAMACWAPTDQGAAPAKGR